MAERNFQNKHVWSFIIKLFVIGEGLQNCNSASFSGEKKYIEAFQSVYFLTKRKKNLKSNFLFIVILVVL